MLTLKPDTSFYILLKSFPTLTLKSVYRSPNLSSCKMQDANSPVSKFSVFYAIDAPQPPLYDFFAIQGGNTSLNGKINQSIKYKNAK